MKRRIFTFLLAAALVLLTACSGRGTEPPVRIGEAIGEASLLRSYSAAEAFQEADADYPDAYQSVGSFSTVLYAADAVDGTRYYLDRFGLMSMREQETGDSALEQPLSRMPSTPTSVTFSKSSPFATICVPIIISYSPLAKRDKSSS